jgi:hypothetical protein
MNKELSELQKKIVKVTFSRVYEIPISDILKYSTDIEPAWNEDPEEGMKELMLEAVRIAEDYFSEEMLDFSENIGEFVSAKTEIIPEYQSLV